MERHKGMNIGNACNYPTWANYETDAPFLIWATVEDGCKVALENGVYTLTK